MKGAPQPRGIWKPPRQWLRGGARSRLIVVAVAISITASACGSGAELPGLGDGEDPLADARVAKDFPCGLLTLEEVQVSVNVSTSRPQERGRPILAGMSMCSVVSGEASDSRFAAASWGLLSESAIRRFRHYKAWNEGNLESLKIAGHEATWDARLGTLVVLTGHRALGIRLYAFDPPLGKGESKAEYVAKSAGVLAERALGRL